MLQPVYNFLGYSLNEIKFVNSHKECSYVGISVLKDAFDSEKKQYTLLIRISADFSNEESYFIFQAVYQINDYAWYKTLNENVRKASFFGIAFPFIREKVFSITSDSNPGLFIPTIDVRNINFEKELRLVKATNWWY